MPATDGMWNSTTTASWMDASPFEVRWRDASDLPAGGAYYRVMIQRGTSYLFTNPTFVRRHVP